MGGQERAWADAWRMGWRERRRAGEAGWLRGLVRRGAPGRGGSVWPQRSRLDTGDRESGC